MRVTELQVAVLVCAVAAGCSETGAPPDAGAMQNRLASSCIGQVVNNTVWIYGPGGSAVDRPLPADARFEMGKISRRGDMILGWNIGGLFALDVGSGQISRLVRIQLTSSDFDLSADGSKIVWTGRDIVSGKRGLLRLDTQSDQVEVIASSGAHPSMSPDGSSVAFEDGPLIKIHTNHAIRNDLTSPGSFPSWANDGLRVAYWTSKSSYRILDISTAESREMLANGEVVGPLQWSGDGTLVIYVTRTWRDYWAPYRVRSDIG